jgi:integrase
MSASTLAASTPRGELMPEGITPRHQRSCASRDGGRCNCNLTFQAQVWSTRERRRISRSFPSEPAAKTWRQDAIVDLRRGAFPLGRAVTLAQVAREWIADAKAGLVVNRSGDPYKPSTLRGYEQAINQRILPVLGPWKLADIRRSDVQRLVSHLQRQGLDPSTIRNALMPLRAIFRRALSMDDVVVNPTEKVQLPAVRGERDRFSSPVGAAGHLAKLGDDDRALFATAFYAGLRMGELRALRWENVDVATGVIRVHATWDHREGPVEPKSKKGRRRVPIPAVLRDVLLEHRMRQERAEGLVFGAGERPFSPSSINDRADRICGDGVLRLHDARHSYASFMIAAGVNLKALSEFMGHASITITLDRYGHLLPGSEDEAAELLDGYLARANTEARKAALT